MTEPTQQRQVSAVIRYDDWSPETVQMAPCISCKHKNPNGPRCLAFPEVIPDEILLGEHQHRTPFKGDNGVMYEQEEDVISFELQEQ